MIDDLIVYCLAEDRFLVVANAANAPTVFGELSARAEGLAVAVSDRSTATALIAVQGPDSQDIVTALGPVQQARLVAELKYYAVTHAEIAGFQVLLARTGYTGEDGFELYVPNAGAVEIWRALLSATTDPGGSPAGLACRDTLRLEAGMALYGHELTLDTNPYEAGLGKAVRLNKNFVGRNALQVLSDRAPQRLLVGLAGTGRRAARAEYTVQNAAGDLPIGIITSGALSPTLGHLIALTYVDISQCEPGTVVTVDIRGKLERFTVTPTAVLSPLLSRSAIADPRSACPSATAFTEADPQGVLLSSKAIPEVCQGSWTGPRRLCS